MWPLAPRQCSKAKRSFGCHMMSHDVTQDASKASMSAPNLLSSFASSWGKAGASEHRQVLIIAVAVAISSCHRIPAKLKLHRAQLCGEANLHCSTKFRSISERRHPAHPSAPTEWTAVECLFSGSLTVSPEAKKSGIS
jgi:hypothetical protein